jgi:hypothetical protein
MTEQTAQYENAPRICRPPRRLRRTEASEFLKREFNLSYTPRTLAKMASTSSDGPVFRKTSGRAVLYEEDDLRAWAEAKIGPRVRSTSELTQAA